ncbi:MAG: hypothetical protein ACI808_002805 [Paraglaciecola sp.]|jgi:hypothetical protein
MKTLSIIALLLVSISVAATVVYKKTNQDGTVTYSDEPSEGAVLLEQPTSNTVIMPSLLPPKRPLYVSEGSKKSSIAKTLYSLKIVSPAAEQTVRNNLGEVDIVASISPKASGIFQLMLNGELHLTKPNPVFHLKDLQRGEYSLQVRFVGKSGRILALTDTQIFYLHKASVFINSN